MSEHTGWCHSVALDPERVDVCYTCGEDGDVLMFDLREPRYLSRKVILCKDRNSRVSHGLRMQSLRHGLHNFLSWYLLSCHQTANGSGFKI